METQTVPEEILNSYKLTDVTGIRRLSGGLVNQTFLIEQTDKQTVLQQVAPFITADALIDAKHVGDHMAALGWDAPQLLASETESLGITDKASRLWRCLKFIESDSAPPISRPGLEISMAELLGAWHHDSAQLRYTPVFSLDHFHDTPFIAQKLIGYLAEFDQGDKDTASEIYESFRILPDAAIDHPHIIHGDPKMDNMLFRNDKPFTLIDYDTVMVGSPWTDVGDMFRSVVGKRLDDKPLSAQEFGAMARAYSERLDDRRSNDELFELAVQATARIALELGMRYLCDSVEDYYFSWDADRYDSRRTHHSAKAVRQLKVARAVIDFIA